MARDYMVLVKQVEGYFAKALGTATLNGLVQTQDESLRQQLVPFTNSIFSEIERLGRWRKGFTTSTIVTNGTSTYSMPRFDYVHRIYWRFATGRIQDLELMDQNEPRQIFGDGPAAIPGQPRYYAFVGTQGDQIQLYPTPDGSGPDGGNYTLQVEYYQPLAPIVETTGTITVASTSLAVTTGTYLLAAGVVPANPNVDTVTIRGCGGITGLSGINNRDDFTTPWTNIAGNTATLANPAPANATNFQTFFYSSNWLIDIWPKVPLFALLREVATYLKADQVAAAWQARYADQVELLMEWDQQSRHDVEVLAGAVVGQKSPLLRDRTSWAGYDVRGIVE